MDRSEKWSDAHLGEVMDQARASVLSFSPRCRVVDDVVQTVLERYLLHTGDVEDWRAWIKTVAKRCTVDATARDRLRNFEALSSLDDHWSALEVTSAPAVRRDQIRRYLGILSPSEQGLLSLSLDGHSNEEIAKVHGYATAASVATILSRAKGKIRRAFPDMADVFGIQRIY